MAGDSMKRATDARPTHKVNVPSLWEGKPDVVVELPDMSDQATGTRVGDFVDEIIAERGPEFAEMVERELAKRRSTRE